MSLSFITGNEGKLCEAKRILGNVEALPIDVPEIQSMDAHEIIVHKLNIAMGHHSGACFVEDTSLYCEGMEGLPGPLIKWFLNTVGNDGIFKMVNVFQNSRAEAKTIIGYIDESSAVSFFAGSVRGTIVEPRGQGFGWDPIFQPEGYTKTFGEMSAEEKDAISMRKIALEKLRDHILSQGK